MPSLGDLTAILAHNGLDFPDAALTVQVVCKDAAGKRVTVTEKPREVLRQVAKQEALLAITERLRYARTLARKKGEPLDWSHFINAHLIIARQAEQEGEWN